MRSSVGAVVALLAAALLVLAGCGGGTSSTTDSVPPSSSTSSPTSTTGASSSGEASTTTGSSATSSVTTAPPGGPPPCATSALRGAVGPQNAGAGSVFTTVTLTNHGTASCSLYGYPGVSLSANGSQLGQPATRSAQWGPVVVTLAPGQATAFVVHTNTGVAGPCQPADAMVVFPPNQRASLSIPADLQLCGTLLETTAVGNHP